MNFFSQCFFSVTSFHFLLKWNNQYYTHTSLNHTNIFTHIHWTITTMIYNKNTTKTSLLFLFSLLSHTLLNYICVSFFCFVFYLFVVNKIVFGGRKKLVGQINLLSKPLPLRKRKPKKTKLWMKRNETKKKHFYTKYAMVFPVIVVVYHLFSFRFFVAGLCIIIFFWIRYSFLVAVITAIISDASSTNMLILRDW